MNNQELLNIRQQILDSSLPLLLESNAAPEDRFDILLRFIRLNSATKSSELYKKAYETALSFEDTSDRLDALLRLLGAVDAEIDNRPEAEAAVAESVNPQELAPQNNIQPVQNDEQQRAPMPQQQERVDN